MSVIEFTGRDRASSRPPPRAVRERNPLRLHAERVSLAVTIVGKLANGDADHMKKWGDNYVVDLLRGAGDSARFLADELDRVAREAEQGLFDCREGPTDEAPPPVA